MVHDHGISGGAADSHTRQRTEAVHEVDRDLQAGARLAFDKRLRVSTRRWPRPIGPRLEARLAASASAGKINLVGRGTLQCRVRAIPIVPETNELELTIAGAAQERYPRHSAHGLFQRADETLDDRNAPLLADGAEALTNAVTAAPASEAGARKLPALVSDQVFRRSTPAGHDSAKKLPDLC